MIGENDMESSAGNALAILGVVVFVWFLYRKYTEAKARRESREGGGSGGGGGGSDRPPTRQK